MSQINPGLLWVGFLITTGSATVAALARSQWQAVVGLCCCSGVIAVVMAAGRAWVPAVVQVLYTFGVYILLIYVPRWTHSHPQYLTGGTFSRRLVATVAGVGISVTVAVVVSVNSMHVSTEGISPGWYLSVFKDIGLTPLLAAAMLLFAAMVAPLAVGHQTPQEMAAHQTLAEREARAQRAQRRREDRRQSALERSQSRGEYRKE